MTGSTLRIVTADFAKQLPKKIPTGKVLKANTKKAINIRDFLPVNADTVYYVLFCCPNTVSISGGEDYTVKGVPDDSMHESFRALGDYDIAWLQIIASTHNSTFR